MRPGIPDAITEPSDEVVQIGDREYRGVNTAVSNETMEEYRLGYRCLNCHVAQPEAFPDVCVETSYGICGYRIKRDQLRDLENTARGERWYGPSEVEPAEKQRVRGQSSIWVPGRSTA